MMDLAFSLFSQVPAGQSIAVALFQQSTVSKHGLWMDGD